MATARAGMDDRQLSGLTKLGFGVVACSSVLAIYRSGGDAMSVAFVLLADAALALLFLCLRAFERGGGGRADAKTKATVWALTTALLTDMVAPGAAPTIIVPLAVGALVFLCLRDVGQAIRAGDGGGRVANMDDAQYCALAKVGFAVVTCNAALDAYDDDTRRDDPGSAALVLVSYTVLVILTGLFVRAVARGHAGDGENGQG